jgi:hypothetical protein
VASIPIFVPVERFCSFVDPFLGAFHLFLVWLEHQRCEESWNGFLGVFVQHCAQKGGF